MGSNVNFQSVCPTPLVRRHVPLSVPTLYKYQQWMSCNGSEQVSWTFPTRVDRCTVGISVQENDRYAPSPSLTKSLSTPEQIPLCRSYTSKSPRYTRRHERPTMGTENSTACDPLPDSRTQERDVSMTWDGRKELPTD